MHSIVIPGPRIRCLRFSSSAGDSTLDCVPGRTRGDFVEPSMDYSHENGKKEGKINVGASPLYARLRVEISVAGHWKHGAVGKVVEISEGNFLVAVM